MGLAEKRLGSLKLGRLDLHYHNEPSNIRAKAGSYKASPIALLVFAGGGGTAIAANSRTPNVVQYDSPRWSGFAFGAAYSSAPTGVEADIGSGTRKGYAWNLHPNHQGRNFRLGYSYWKQKADVAGPGSDQRGDRLYGALRWSGFEVGLAWDDANILDGLTGVKSSSRKAWSIPVQYEWGRHAAYAHYTRARDDTITPGRDGAKMWALAYNYDLSKRTSVAVAYAKIRNDAFGVYNLDGSAGANGSPSGAVLAGEDPSHWALTLRHNF